jgi:hypothetical protein
MGKYEIKQESLEPPVSPAFTPTYSGAVLESSQSVNNVGDSGQYPSAVSISLASQRRPIRSRLHLS